MEIQIKRSNRRTLSIEITQDAAVLVRAPQWVSMREINRFVTKKADWIEKHRAKMLVRMEERSEIKKLTVDEISELAEKAIRELPPKVAYYAERLGVTYGRITIRNQRSRWGSCSSKGNLNFNCLLMLTPEYVQDYVVVHELCHRLEMNHSERFWKLVEMVIPEYPPAKKWLKENGANIIGRMT